MRATASVSLSLVVESWRLSPELLCFGNPFRVADDSDRLVLSESFVTLVSAYEMQFTDCIRHSHCFAFFRCE